jgi:hypothetical protein
MPTPGAEQRFRDTQQRLGMLRPEGKEGVDQLVGIEAAVYSENTGSPFLNCSILYGMATPSNAYCASNWLITVEPSSCCFEKRHITPSFEMVFPLYHLLMPKLIGPNSPK